MTNNEKDVIRFFYRHIVPIFITLKTENDTQRTIITAFVMSIKDKWFLVTAGHVINKIDTLISEHGYTVAKCDLIDGIGDEADYKNPIPFIYQQANPTCLSDERDFDYGVLEVSPYYQELLERNNVQPLDEKVWKNRPKVIDFYMLMGIPFETIHVHPKNIEFTPKLFFVKYLPEQPHGFPDTPIPQFYGEIILDGDIKSIEGVSGGPIFGFYENPPGQMRYWVVALQSTWLPKSRIISACPTHILGDVIEQGYTNLM